MGVFVELSKNNEVYKWERDKGLKAPVFSWAFKRNVTWTTVLKKKLFSIILPSFPGSQVDGCPYHVEEGEKNET